MLISQSVKSYWYFSLLPCIYFPDIYFFCCPVSGGVVSSVVWQQKRHLVLCYILLSCVVYPQPTPVKSFYFGFDEIAPDAWRVCSECDVTIVFISRVQAPHFVSQSVGYLFITWQCSHFVAPLFSKFLPMHYTISDNRTIYQRSSFLGFYLRPSLNTKSPTCHFVFVFSSASI